MSVLDDFVRIRLYRERASEFELLAEAEASPDVRLRFRVIARHYRELMDRELQADNARMAELIERADLCQCWMISCGYGFIESALRNLSC